MANYLTRIELHAANSADYERLHEEMGARGFSTRITWGGGTFDLPTAEYFIVTTLPTAEVDKLAKAAATATGRSYWTLTVRFDDAAGWLATVK